MWLFKLLGLTVILGACSLLGILKAENLKRRAEQLEKFIKALSHLAELVRIGNYEINELCAICSLEPLVTVKDGSVNTLCEYLLPRDREIIEEYFSGFGIADAEGEQSRTELYINMLKQEYSSATELYSKQGGLYRSVGFMSGLILCIFFM